jgi:hypothetical protein
LSYLSPTSILPLTTTPPSFPAGKTVLAIGVVSGLADSVYNTPYIVRDLISAATFFGVGSFTRALGELIRQGAGAIIAVAVYQYSDMPIMLDLFRTISYDVLLPVGVLANASTLPAFSSFSAGMQNQGNAFITVMAVDPTPGVASLVASPVGALCGTYNDGLNPFDSIARNFVFTLDQVTINPNVPSQYQASSAASIAGMMANTLPQTSLANMTLTGLNATNLYDPTDAMSLSNAGYMVLRSSARRGITPFLAVTGTSTSASATNYSPNFHNLSTMRSINYVITQLNVLTQSLIGEPSPTNVSTSVTNLLTSIQNQGTIIDFNVTTTVAALAGQILINVSVLPYGETIYANVSQQVNLS